MGTTEASGRLEICDNQVWFSILRSRNWVVSMSETVQLVCQLLGYGGI